MEVESYEHGVPSWVDHSSPDPVKAGAFYSGVFGWDVQEGDPEFGGYTMATKDGRNVAGIGPSRRPARRTGAPMSTSTRPMTSPRRSGPTGAR